MENSQTTLFLEKVEKIKRSKVLFGVLLAFAVTLSVTVFAILVVSRNNSTTNNITVNTNASDKKSTDNLNQNELETSEVTVDVTPTPSLELQNEELYKEFSNEFLSFKYPSDWEVTKTGGGANIIRGNYILYVNPNYSQASGVRGARLSEIASGAPGADIVLTVHPAYEGSCGSTEKISIDKKARNDLFVSVYGTGAQCNLPTDNQTHWYFSFVNTDFGYVNYYKDGQVLSYVITMTYKTDDVNKLPVKGSVDLENNLEIMTEIVKTMSFARLMQPQ